MLRNEERIEALIKRGLHFIYVGFESFLDSHLAFYQKDVSSQTIIDAFHLLGSMDLTFNFGHLIFNPITTKKDLLEIFDILKNLKKYKNCAYFETPIFNAASVFLIHGTSLCDFIQKHGLQAQNTLGYRFLESEMNDIYPLFQKWYIYVEPYYAKVRTFERNEEYFEMVHKLFQIDLAMMTNLCVSKKLHIDQEDEYWLKGLLNHA